MQNLTLTLRRFAVVCSGALTLAACNRAEYATLPRSASYLGSTPVAAAPRPAAPVAATTPATAATPEAALTAVVPAAPIVAAPVATAAPAVATAPAAAPAEVAPAPAKLNLVQRLALAKVTKKINKLAAKAPQFKQHDATAHTARIEGNLRSAIIFGLLSLIAFIIGGGFFNVLGSILLIVGIVFLVLWILDQA